MSRWRSAWLACLWLGAGVAACTSHSDEHSDAPWPEQVFPVVPPILELDRPGTSGSQPAREPIACPRRGGSLEVLCTTPPLHTNQGGRLRTHARGTLGANDLRLWSGPPVPSFVALTIGTEELSILDETADGFMALYRDPLGASSCWMFDDETNCQSHVRIHDRKGQLINELHLDDYLSRRTQLEIQDARYDDGVLYFNEACASYSRDAGGRCSALLAVDVASKQLRWRTKHLVSNNVFITLDDYLVASYAFTAETPSLSLIDKRNGKVTWTMRPPRGIEWLERVDGSTVRAHDSGDRTATFVVRNAKLVRTSG